MTTLYLKTKPELASPNLHIKIDFGGEIKEAVLYDFDMQKWLSVDPRDITEYMLSKINKEFESFKFECLRDHF